MAVVTLTTDLGLKDYYVASLKAALISQEPSITIVDISHEIKAFDLIQASIVVKNSYKDFPPDTIHIIGINTDVKSDSQHLAVKIHGQYFIMPDNGIISLIFDSKPDEVFSLNLVQRTELLTFPAKDIYVQAACHLARGGALQLIGKPFEGKLRELAMLRAVSEGKIIRGTVNYIDHYGNALTNIDENLFRSFNKNGKFTIHLRRSEYKIHKINKTYFEVPLGEKLALFSSSGHLEISINQGNASKLLGINVSDMIIIEFDDH